MRYAEDARSAAVVVNTGSRRGAAAYDEVLARLASEGVPVRSAQAVSHGSELPAAVGLAVSDGHDLVIVGGGDGTIGCAAGLVAGTPATLGVLPLGTANDFARTLELPADVAGACAALAHGEVVDVDLGRVDGRTFLNVASVGLSVGVAEALTAGLKRRLGPLAYPVATLRAYRRHRPFSARLEFPHGDHGTLELDDLMQVAVGNGRHYGGGNTVAPNAGIDDHTLDVYAIVRGRLREHVSIARLLRDGSFVHHDRVHHVTTQAVRVVTDEPLPVNLDGEVETATPSLIEVARNALHVVVPRDSRAATLDGARVGGQHPPTQDG
ncbi:MAG TPA: lipid kinase [Nocardioides sp.]|uniref:lipid kinase n=1 Tax=Nocardioides sp. TaxID=35761 RepID=UPI002D80F57E|nr:lipid kinase [Nocardioides sp.]HET6652921.1 lipid kinase [Nocardioides sp.]